MINIIEALKKGKHNREYNEEAKKHKDDTETLEAVVYDKAMSTLYLPTRTLTTAYVIVFVDNKGRAFQCLTLDKPWEYASFEKGNVCEIVVKTKAYEFPYKEYPVMSVKLIRRN
jgi:hypothetical protein